MKGKDRVYFKRIILAIVIFIGVIINMITPEFLPIHYAASVIWCGIIIWWMFSIRKRILYSGTFGWLYAGGYMLLTLFSSRVARYALADYSEMLGRQFWYLYYVPYVGMGVVFLCAALNVGSRTYSNKVIKTVLCVLGAVLSVLAITNDMHGLLIKFTEGGYKKYTYGVLFYVVTVFCYATILTGYVILIIKCSVSECRKKFFIPLLFGAVGFTLNAIYMANGSSSPKLFGLGVYNIQEIWAFTFISIFESCIAIGLITSNTEYEEIFEKSSLRIGIADHDGKTVITSHDDLKVENKEILDASRSETPTPFSDDTLLSVKRIPGGYAGELIDISKINEINSELEDALSQLESENEVKKMRLEMDAQLAGIEARNRIYEEIASANEKLIEETESLIESGERKGMFKALLNETYLKRRVNIMLAAQESETIDITELYIAAGEITANMTSGGINACTNLVNEGEFPVEGIRNLLDFMIEIVKESIDSLTVFLATVYCEKERSYGIRLMIDADEKTFDAIKKIEADLSEKYGGNIEADEEDGDITVSLEYTVGESYGR